MFGVLELANKQRHARGAEAANDALEVARRRATCDPIRQTAEI
jgi:hypothetical protein